MSVLIHAMRLRTVGRTVCCTIALIVAACAQPVAAQGPQLVGTWSGPEQLSRSGEAANYQLLASDATGCVYVMWTVNTAPGTKDLHDSAYFVVSCGNYWTDPIDVLAVSDTSRLDLWGLTAARGSVLALWSESGALRLSEAESAVATAPQAWVTTDLALGMNVTAATYRADESDVLHVLFVADSRGLYYMRIEPNGDSSEIVVVAETTDPELAYISPVLAVADQHVVATWSTAEAWNNWSPTGLFSARSVDGGASWSADQALSSRVGDGPSSMAYDAQGRLHLLWVGTLQLGGRYHRYSSDHGATWTETETVTSDLKGLTGGGTPLVDSAGTLHWVFGGLGPDGEGVRYATWRDGEWSPIQRISGDLPQSEGGGGTLALGHILHVAWTDLKKGLVYYSRLDTGSPALEPVQSVSPTATIGPTRAPEPPVQATLPVGPVTNVTPDAPAAGTSTGSVMVLMLLPPVLLVTAVVLTATRRRR